jgi:hypothetical protein
MTSDERPDTVPYEPLTRARLVSLLADADERLRWRLVAEFLEEYRDSEDIRLLVKHLNVPDEPVPDRARLVLEDVFDDTAPR